MKDDTPKRRRIQVCCIFCGAWLYTLVNDYYQVLGTCLTCVSRVKAGKLPGV